MVKGLSLGEIQKLTQVPKTTIYKWIGELQLSTKQREKIRVASLKLLQEGRIFAQAQQKKRKLEKENRLFIEGENEINSLQKRDIFIAGVALYWAEGFKNKHEHRLGFCNSDPRMIKFYLYWLKETLSVKKEDLVARVTLNESYKEKEKEIKSYWSEVTEIPVDQFTKTFYQKTQWKKEYTDMRYYGVLRIHVKESLDSLLKMKGWIEGLKVNLPG